MRAYQTLVREAPVVTVPRLWPDSTVVCLGSGPSLDPVDIEYCRGKAHVIAIKDAVRLAPWADVLYACDAKWWTYYGHGLRFGGLRYALEPGAAPWGATVLRYDPAQAYGLSDDPSRLATGKNSGYQAINLAVHLGASRILLLGYDMQPGPDGRDHWFGRHPYPGAVPVRYADFKAAFRTIVEPLRARGVAVINCTPGSVLDLFPQQPLREALS